MNTNEGEPAVLFCSDHAINLVVAFLVIFRSQQNLCICWAVCSAFTFGNPVLLRFRSLFPFRLPLLQQPVRRDVRAGPVVGPRRPRPLGATRVLLVVRQVHRPGQRHHLGGERRGRHRLERVPVGRADRDQKAKAGKGTFQSRKGESGKGDIPILPARRRRTGRFSAATAALDRGAATAGRGSPGPSRRRPAELGTERGTERGHHWFPTFLGRPTPRSEDESPSVAAVFCYPRCTPAPVRPPAASPAWPGKRSPRPRTVSGNQR